MSIYVGVAVIKFEGETVPVIETIGTLLYVTPWYATENV
jgi:hypothetical protein